MTRFGEARAPVRHAPATPGPSVPLRDLTDEEYADAVDADREQADALLHADWSWCAFCRQPTLATRRGACLFCDGMTYPYNRNERKAA